ncbi:MAG TPA: sigma-54 dependent transcriptional regulator [Rhodocyclaceae bacterium]|nr:sigma-54-dependent Fis family transcriptional regulator [Rhodocyclaceae bacterium]HMV53690.1 sigma-54 dependent transcriptional regulator [Rhodocyclaceae bacterium]HMZ84887.1 sigma-54 dependent transcriptional regulator [Rhodocyclaceae bacterium]HNA03384.1 sigma-54 dependent transcriptional regulator [Rhodocyclaceae bacterium]HNB77712.1 sigma-54 dependent transcriptional regulator [Rhodocyclaceae bacterium]
MNAPLGKPPRLPSVLVVDDEVRSQESLRRTLEEEFEVFTASGADEAQVIMEREFIQLILCDQRMPGTSGVQFLKRVRAQWPDTVRIIISGYTDAEDIIAGINDAGIYQYMLKPWQPDQLLLTLKGAAELHRLQQENQRLSLDLRAAEPVLKRRVDVQRTQAKHRFGVDSIARTEGSPMNRLCAMVQKVAPYDVSILLSGESGTGKELLARALHYQSGRAERPFVTENCAALPDQLLESELFGYKRGAFTGAFEDRIGLFQQANGGTLFLDEIGETSPAFQAKLLRVLQEGEVRPLGSPRPQAVDVRVVAATNRDLELEVREGRFREDLYYRIATVALQVPPLRERPMDIPLIAQGFLSRSAITLGRDVEGFAPNVIECLRAYRWPGNVRELQNEILRMLALSDGAVIGAEHLSTRVLHAAREEEERDLDVLTGIDGNLKDRMEALEARVLRETLIRHRWNKTRAAAELGLSRVGLRSKLSRYGLDKAN